MMIDYNVSDHWSADDPDWLKSLVSSLDRRHGLGTVQPLTVIVAEILEWLELASGVDAWKVGPNRKSLQLDLDESIETLGDLLRAHIAVPLAQFTGAFSKLISGPKSILAQATGTRTDAVWTNVVRTASDLLEALDADAAVRASWDDLVGAAKDRTLVGREYRPIANLLFDQLHRRGLDAGRVFQNLVSMMAFGRGPSDVSRTRRDVPLERRVANARTYVGTPAEVEPIVVWLGYQGDVWLHLSAERVSFMNAHWAVPNAEPTGQNFEHKNELWELVRDGHLFKVAELVDEESEVDFLVRVDLGLTTSAGAFNRAIDIVDTILNILIHNSGGARPHLAQHAILRSGRAASHSFGTPRGEAGFSNDHYGADITARAIEEHGLRIAEALAREELPRFLAAALEVQAAADHPFSRDMALRKPSEADLRSVIPLADRVVQHVAAYAALAPDRLFDLLGGRWPHARWRGDVQRAVGMCLLGGGDRRELVNELTGELFAKNPRRPWILLVADRSDDLLALCRIESERGWIRRVFASVSDHTEYRALIDIYTAEQGVLEARRRRVRNALVHSNPSTFTIVDSVREYAEFLSGSALELGLKSYVEATAPAATLAARTAEFTAMQTGLDCASYWRAQLIAESGARADSS